MNPADPIDLSHKLDPSIPVYPGDTPFSCTPHATIPIDGYSVTTFTLSSHTGTHIDAPSHFFTTGKSIDQLPLSSLIGPALVIDVRGKAPRAKITWEDIQPHSDEMNEGVILLLYTGWDTHWKTPMYYEHPYLTRDAAERIIVTGVKVIGVDTFSPDETPYLGKGGAEGFGVHEVILGSGGIIAENLNNLGAIYGRKDVNINLIPLNLAGSDGSPVRAIAWSTKQET